MNTPAQSSRNTAKGNSLQRIAFYTLAGVAAAHCDGELVRGRWSDISIEVRSGKNGELVTDFANWPDTSKSIVKFTLRYGPLDIRPSFNAELSGNAFEFSLDEWRKRQKQFRDEWEMYGQWGGGDKEIVEVAPREQLIRQKVGLEYRASTLSRLLTFSLASIPSERLRVCARPSCTHPYFIPHHLKQNYCSDGCARWGQQKWKKQWWDEHGKAWRKKQVHKIRARQRRKTIA